MRRSQLRETPFLLNQKMAVTGTDVECIAVSRKLFLQCFYENSRVGRINLVRTVVDYNLILIVSPVF